MVKEIIENGGKVVRIAEDIQVGGTLPLIISIVSIGVVIFWQWVKYKQGKEDREEDRKDQKEMMSHMQSLLETNKEIAESNRSLVDSNSKKDEYMKFHLNEFNSIRKMHIKEIERVNDSARNVNKTLEKVVIKLDNMDIDIKETKAILKAR